MKKMVTTLLAGIMLVLVGCSSGGEKEAAGVASVTTADSTATEAAVDAQRPDSTNTVTLTETVVYDENGIKITATSLKEDGILGPELTFLIENDSAQNIVVQPDYCLVNGYAMTGLMSSDVAAGKKNNDTLDFMDSSLKQCNIEQIADIRVKFTISDGDTYQMLYKTEEVTLQTSAAGQYTQTYDDSGSEIYNSNGIRVVAKGSEDEFLGKGIIFYLENTTNQAVSVSADNISVNGFMVTDLFYADLPPQSYAVDSLTLLDSELKENSIDAIEEVELSLRLIDSESYSVIDSTGPITLHF